jgi:dipeptidyl aminopeptidase/acylaminoacyl peptidase
VQELSTGDCFFEEVLLSHDKSMISFIAQTPSSAPEAYVSPLDNFKPIQVSALNQSFLSYPSIKNEVISWKSTDGLDIEGHLTYPISYQEGQQYPLLVVIHGGPMGFFDESFLGKPSPYPLASFAEAGFFILRPNPRGSCGYGKEYRCANYGDWGGMDFKDIMTGVDTLIAKRIVNPERLGVMGWSYGGYMTAWIVTQTSRFQAASIGAGLYNLVSATGTTDLPRFLPDCMGDFVYGLELYEKRSPIHHVLNINTPCLIQHGLDDKRVPVSQAYEFYHTLQRIGKKPTLILYPGTDHKFTHPKMLLDAMERNLNWFQQHLQPE